MSFIRRVRYYPGAPTYSSPRLARKPGAGGLRALELAHLVAELTAQGRVGSVDGLTGGLVRRFELGQAPQAQAAERHEDGLAYPVQRLVELPGGEGRGCAGRVLQGLSVAKPAVHLVFGREGQGPEHGLAQLKEGDACSPGKL